MSNGKRVLGNLTSRLAERFESVDAGRESLPAVQGRAKSAPGHLLELTGVGQELTKTKEELEELRKQQASGFEVELSQLRASPYQIGGLQQARVDALVQNLKHNQLNTPIVVRPTSEPGVFEILAGHHRVEAHRILERPRIRAVLREASDDEAERLVFYDNLLAPSLSDYDKYLGFSARQKSKGLTLEQIADEAGVSKTQVSKLLAFDRLPKAAQDLVRDNPKATGVGANLFADLAPLAAANEAKVVEAVSRVIQGKLAAGAAATWVNSGERSAPRQAERTLVKRGRQTFAEVRNRGTQWVVNFASEADAEVYGKKLLELVQQASAETP